jgi:hypothetical protein
MIARDLAALPARLWFVNTDMRSFNEFPRAAGDASPFSHWVAAGRLFVTPRPESPQKYNNALVAMQAGDPVFAYEDQLGIVGLGWVADNKDLTTAAGGSTLYPNPAEIVRSVAVHWDTTVTRSVTDVSAKTIVTGQGLRRSHEGSPLHSYLVTVLRDAAGRNAPDLDAPGLDAIEAAVIERLCSDRTTAAVTRPGVIAARVGQGLFRRAVLDREPACRVTGITEQACLVASHIKPWALCGDGEHTDGANGLALAPHIDLLFDTGRISFTDDGALLVAPGCGRDILAAWAIDPATRVGAFSADQAAYLAFHRRFVFSQPRPRRRRNVAGESPVDDESAPFSPFSASMP